MSKEKRRVPKLRFPGFTEDWEQRKLSDILKVNSGKDYKHLEQGDIPVYGTGGYMLSVNESLSNIDAIGIGRKGTIDKPQYLKAPFWTVDTLFYLTALDKHSILFLYYLMQLMPWKKFDESTGVPSLSKTTIDNINGYVPSNPKEEELISALFNQLDKSITLHQRKLNNLKLKKKALLQKLFPKNGERYPELRFPGFTDAWEQRKFGELFILKSGVAFKLSEYTKTGIPIINGESIKAGKISLEKINYLPNEYQYKYQECLLFPGDIVLGLNRPIIDGTLKISRIPADIKKSLLYQRAGKIIFKVNMDENFTYQLLSKEVLTFTKKEAVGSDQPFITTTKLNKGDLYFPVKDKERRNIGSLFNNIDNIITLHQRKLDHLQLQKKALLQQMFV